MKGIINHIILKTIPNKDLVYFIIKVCLIPTKIIYKFFFLELTYDPACFKFPGYDITIIENCINFHRLTYVFVVICSCS